MLNETHRAPPRYKISAFFSSLLGPLDELNKDPHPKNIVELRRRIAERISKDFDQARAQGATVVRVANDFMNQKDVLDLQHEVAGMEVIEEKKASKPTISLARQAEPLLQTLSRTPLLRRRHSGVWAVEEVKESADELAHAALRSLGFAAPNEEDNGMTVQSEVIIELKKSIWRRDIFGRRR
jgi:hypothetical protein